MTMSVGQSITTALCEVSTIVWSAPRRGRR